MIRLAASLLLIDLAAGQPLGLHGTVRDGYAHTPLPGAVLTLVKAGATRTTDAEGRFAFGGSTGLAPAPGDGPKAPSEKGPMRGFDLRGRWLYPFSRERTNDAGLLFLRRGAGEAVNRAPAKRSASASALDTLRVEKPGYATRVVPLDPDAPESLSVDVNPMERLRFDGGDILDAQGRPITLHGWNWGHWGSTQPGDARAHVGEGANIVRVIFRWWGLYGGKDIDAFADAAPGHIDSGHLALLDAYIDSLSAAGIWIDLAIDSNCGQNGAQDSATEAYCTIDGARARNFWNDTAMRSKFKETWRFVANRYKGVSRIAWYEPLPEPSAPGYGNADVKAFYSEMIGALRAEDPATPILIGAGGAYNINQAALVYDPGFTNVVYTGDLLDPAFRNTTTFPGKLQSLLDLRSQHHVPVFVQQAGIKSSSDPDQSLLKNGLGLLEADHVGYTVWEYRGSADSTEYSMYYRSGDGWKLKAGPYAAVCGFLKP